MATTSNSHPEKYEYYATREMESPPLTLGPRRLHYAYSVALPLIHLTFVSIVQGIALSLLFQSFPLPRAETLASTTTLVSFVTEQHAYLPYLISGLIVVLVWKQFVQNSMFFVWPISTSQIILMLLISLMEVVAFREISHFGAWLAGIGLIGCVGGCIRLNNLRVHPTSAFESELVRRRDRTMDLRDGLLYVLLGLLISAGALILHGQTTNVTVSTGIQWAVLAVLSCLMVVVSMLDRFNLISMIQDMARNSDLRPNRFGGIEYYGDEKGSQ